MELWPRVRLDATAGDVDGDFETWTDGVKMAEAGTVGDLRSPFPFLLDVSFVGDGPGQEALRVDLYEDVLDGDNYRMCTPRHGGQCWPIYAEGGPIPALSTTAADIPDTDAISGVYEWQDELDDPEYHYKMSYRVRHERMPCRGTSGPDASDCPAAGTICSDSDPKFTGYTSSPRCVCVADAGCPAPQTCDTTTGFCRFP